MFGAYYNSRRCRSYDLLLELFQMVLERLPVLLLVECTDGLWQREMGQIIGADLRIKKALVAERLPLLPQKELKGCGAGLVGAQM